MTKGPLYQKCLSARDRMLNEMQDAIAHERSGNDLRSVIDIYRQYLKTSRSAIADNPDFEPKRNGLQINFGGSFPWVEATYESPTETAARIKQLADRHKTLGCNREAALR